MVTRIPDASDGSSGSRPGGSLTAITVMLKPCAAEEYCPAVAVLGDQHDAGGAKGVGRRGVGQHACRGHVGPRREEARVGVTGDVEAHRLAGFIGRSRRDRRGPGAHGLWPGVFENGLAQPAVKEGGFVHGVYGDLKLCASEVSSSPGFAVPPLSWSTSVMVALPKALAVRRVGQRPRSARPKARPRTGSSWCCR